MRYNFLLLFFICSIAQCQSKPEIRIHENRDNIHYFPMKRGLKKGCSKFNTLSIGLGKYLNDDEAKLFGFTTQEMNTSLEFILKDKDWILYRYPVDPDEFNFKYFEKKIWSRQNMRNQVKICFDKKFLDSIPVVLIRKIKLTN